MSSEIKYAKLVVYVPVKDADLIRRVLAESGAGKIGNYDSCSFSVKGIGRFRPLEGSDPAIGITLKLEEVEEERIEVVCLMEEAKELVKRVKEAHPYEEPAIEVYPVLLF